MASVLVERSGSLTNLDNGIGVMKNYIANFIEPEDRFKILWDELAWIKHDDAPRREYWVTTLGKSYTYGRGAGQRTYQPQPTHPVIESVTDALEAYLGFRYEGCFLNGYATERDALGWHADDDPGIDHAFPIAVVSLYGDGPKTALRIIQTREIEENAAKLEMAFLQNSTKTYVLDDGSLFLMAAGMQQTHRHRIPKAGFSPVRPRISLTYRKLIRKNDDAA